MIHQRLFHRAVGAVLVSAMVLLAACGSSSSGGGGSTASGTPTATLAPTNTPAPTTCAQIAGFESAAASSVYTGFNYGVPAETVQKTPVISAGGAGQFTVIDIDLCTAHTTTDLPQGASARPTIHALEFYGWGMGSIWSLNAFPSDGFKLQTCAAGITCYAYNIMATSGTIPVNYFTEPERYLALSNVQDRGNGLVTWHLQLAAPPVTPTCSDPNLPTLENAIYGASPVYLPGTSTLILPPMTRNWGEGAAGHHYSTYCSAGTTAAIQSLIVSQYQADPKNHLQPCTSGSPATEVCWIADYPTPSSGTLHYTIDMNFANPLSWVIVTTNPM